MKTYKVTLTAVTPVHVGSGGSYSKKEYFFDERTRKVTLLDMNKIMSWIAAQGQPGLIDAFEVFMFSRREQDMLGFLRRIGMPAEKIKESEIYSLPAGDAFAAGRRQRDLRPFMRDARGFPYVPGSTLKGALRTVLLVKMLLDGCATGGIDISDRRAAAKIECELLHTLGRDRRRENARNSVMSGLSVSDSLPFEQKRLMVAAKTDIFTDGEENTLPIFRECAAPGTEITFRLSVSNEAEKTAGAEAIKEAVSAFGDYYTRTYAGKFPGRFSEPLDNCIFLGGGSGYFSKNIVYPRYASDGERALKTVSDIMISKFRRHNHDKDKRLGISPRALKCAYAGGRMRQMGICRVRFDEETE